MTIRKIKRITVYTAIVILSISCGQQSETIKFKTIKEENFVKHPKATEDYHGLKYKISFTYPVSYSDKTVLEKIQKQFIHHALGKKYSSLTPQKAVDALIADLKKAYNEEIKNELKNNNSDWLTGWQIEYSNTILFENKTLLQLKTKNGFYPYAAHVFETSSCHLFNLQTGKEYKRDDIFKPEAAPSIRKLIIPHLLNYWNVKTEKDVMIDKNKVWTTKTNFAVTKKGIHIMYNDGELTGFMPGNPSLTIPYAKIMPYLRQGTPVWKIASQK